MLFDAGELDDLTRALWEDAGMPQDGSGEMSLQVRSSKLVVSFKRCEVVLGDSNVIF